MSPPLRCTSSRGPVRHRPAWRPCSSPRPAPRCGAATAAEAPPERKLRWQYLTGNVKRLHDAGIPVGAGTDAGMPGTFHGYSTLRELELLVQSGLTPLEAITAATSVSARALGVDAQRGTIAEGKVADLVLVQGRPDEQIGDIENTRRVFLGGQELALPELEKAIQSPGMTPLPARSVAPLVDDMERTDGRTATRDLAGQRHRCRRGPLADVISARGARRP